MTICWHTRMWWDLEETWFPHLFWPHCLRSDSQVWKTRMWRHRQPTDHSDLFSFASGYIQVEMGDEHFFPYIFFTFALSYSCFSFFENFFYIYFCLLIIPHQRCPSFILPSSFFDLFFYSLILYLCISLHLSHLIHKSSSLISSLSLFYLLLLTQGLKLFIIKLLTQRFFIQI